MNFRMRTKDEALQLVRELVEQFKCNEAAYVSSSYDESNTRTDFIDKFFEALNWDVRNDNGFAQRFREVVREDKVVINGQTKAPDYSFRIGGQKIFFVEAKKPSVKIKEEVAPAFQVRRYAYTAKLPLSILTDFEEFAVYDTQIKPNSNDKSSVARIRYLRYTEYEENFDYLWETFSKEAVQRGSFDRYCQSTKNKRGTSGIDTELLSTIEKWRLELAKNIALRNPRLNLRNLNVAVQKIIDRIVFLRIAEDKDMEDLETLKKACNGENAYESLKQVFAFANNKYNSGLFATEAWIDTLAIDSKVLKDIASELYYPACPYAWVALPVEVLGNIYEKFLGSEISFKNVKNGHTVTVSEKLSETVDLKYLLAIMSSRYVSVLLTNLRGGDYHIVPEHIRNIPIPSATESQQQKLANLAAQMMDAVKSRQEALSEQEKAVCKMRIEAIGTQINVKVYALYGLTEEESESVWQEKYALAKIAK